MRLGSILLFVIFCFTAALAQPMPDTLWTHYYDDGGGAETPSGIARTANGGYVIVGKTWGPTPTSTYFLTIGANGSVTAQQIINAGGQGNGAVAVYPLTDGSGFILAGYVNNGSAGNDGYIMKTFLIGTPQWTHTFGDPNNDEVILSMAPADDGGFLISGMTTPHGVYNYAGYLAKVNSAGIFQWSRTYSDIGLAAIGRIRPAGSDTYVMAGVADSAHSNGGENYFLTKINGNGDTLWTSIYGREGYNEADDVLITDDGGFLFVGSTWSGGDTGQIYLVRTDANGDSLWTNTISDTTNQYATSVVEGPDGGFVVVGGATAGEWNENLYLVGIDASGNEVWSRVWRNTINGYANELVTSGDGGYVIMADAIPGNSNDVYVIKTGPDLGYGAGDPGPVIPQQWALNAYPNPFNSQARITFTLPQSATVGLDLFNIAGQRVTGLARGNFAPGTHSIDLNGDGLASGVYLVRLEAADLTRSFKLVLMK